MTMKRILSLAALLAALFLVPAAKAAPGTPSTPPPAAPAPGINPPVPVPSPPAATPAPGTPAKVETPDTATKPVPKSATTARRGGGGAVARSQSHLEPIVLDWTDRLQCIPLGIGYPLSVKPDIALNPGMQPKEALCLGKKAEIVARLKLNEDHLSDEGVVVDRARDVDGVLSLSASANGFAQTFIDQESRKVGRPLSQQEVQDRLDCMRAAKAWGITQGKVQYARTGTSAHTMGASRDKRFTQDGRAADGAVGAWCLDKDEVLSLEDARALARRDGGAKDIKELKKRVGRLGSRIDEIWTKIQEMDGKIASHDGWLVNHEGRLQDLERRANWFGIAASLRVPFARPKNVMGGLAVGWMGEPLKSGKLFLAVQGELNLTRDYFLLSDNGIPPWSLGAALQIVVARKWAGGGVIGGVAEGSIAQSVSLADGKAETHGTTHWGIGLGAAGGYVGRHFFALATLTGGVEGEMTKIMSGGRTLFPVKPVIGGAATFKAGIRF